MTAPLAEAALTVEGMVCASDLNAVRNALDGTRGARVRTVRAGLAIVEYDPAMTSPDALANGLSELGYRANVIP